MSASGEGLGLCMSTQPFTISIRVEFGDCDPAGIVFFPNFYRWFDVATHDLCAAVGYSLHQVGRRYGWVGYPIAEAGAKFLLPATFDDTLTIETTLREWRRKVFLVEHRILRDAELLAEGWQTRFIGIRVKEQGNRLRALEIPAHFRDAVDQLFLRSQ